MNDQRRGRVYAGICAPGRGPLTPVVRLWTRLMQTAADNNDSTIDPFWTLVGYFNAIRELGGARALYRQDIPDRLNRIAQLSNVQPRDLSDEHCLELSGRTASTRLPSILDLLNREYPHAADALFTTSMFGTGVDIPRLGLMVVHGQPKTTASYIQATGRVGRAQGGLIVTFLRASRPRDLNHYEFFCGYHCQLHRFVEGVTVMPFAPSAIDRAAGPVSVFMLRNRSRQSVPWHRKDTAALMSAHEQAPEMHQIVSDMEEKSRMQADPRRPPRGYMERLEKQALVRWKQLADQRSDLEYAEYQGTPSHPVVLGDSKHDFAGLPVVYSNAPQSLREIEGTCGFQVS